MSQQVLALMLALAIPLAIAIRQLWPVIVPIVNGIVKGSPPPANLLQFGYQKLIAILTSVAWLALSYPLARLLSMLQLVEPTSLANCAMDIFARRSNLRIVTLGHTHDPEQYNVSGKWFYNTGTWEPIVEATTASLREDKTYTYLHFAHDASGQIVPSPLLRWDDAAGRGEPLTLIETQSPPAPESPVKNRAKKIVSKVRWLGAEP